MHVGIRDLTLRPVRFLAPCPKQLSTRPGGRSSTARCGPNSATPQKVNPACNPQQWPQENTHPGTEWGLPRRPYQKPWLVPDRSLWLCPARPLMTIFLCACMHLYICVGVSGCACVYGYVCAHACVYCLGKLEAGSDHRGESYKGLMPEWVLDGGESQAKHRHRLRGATSEQTEGPGARSPGASDFAQR